MDRTGAAGWKVSLFRQLTRLFTPVDRGERGRWIGGSGEVGRGGGRGQTGEIRRIRGRQSG